MRNEKSSADIFINGLSNGSPESLDSFLHIASLILRIHLVAQKIEIDEAR